MNTLTNTRGLARTSSSPGRTQTINFFLIDESMYFVDLPGYGYAKVAKAIKESWGAMIEGYLRNREQLKLAVMLVDSRMPPTDTDQTMKHWLDHHRIPNTVVLTKTDKLSSNKLRQALRLGAQALNTKEITAFSAVTGAGRDEILARIGAATTTDPTVRKTHL